MDLDTAFTPLKIGPLTLRNRFVKAATNEGMCKSGIISKGLVKHHEDIAAGGAALTTVAYCATSSGGMTFPDQARLGKDTVDDFKVLTSTVQKHNCAASAQITHAGCFTFLPGQYLPGGKPISSSGGFNKVGLLNGNFTKRKMTPDDMDQIAQEYVDAALLAKESGFDAVEIHMGHGYLLSQFLSPFYNRRRDEYGGSIDNRLRYPIEVLSKVLDAVGKDLAVIVKYSQTDGRNGGNTIEDGKQIAKALENAGAHMAVLSNGMNVESISAMFGSSMPEQVKQPPKNPIIRLGMHLQNMTETERVTFSENYLLDNAKKIRASTKMPLCYLGGAQSASGISEALAAGLDAIAMGRALIFDPNFINNLENDKGAVSGCTACNQCVTMMYTPGGTSCIDPSGRHGHDPELNTIRASA